MDFESEMLSYLAEATGAPWYHSVPSDRPGEFGTLSRSGGSRGWAEDVPTITLKVWASTWKRARELSLAAADAVDAAPLNLPSVMAADVLSVYDDYDDEARMPRRRVTAQLTVNR